MFYCWRNKLALRIRLRNLNLKSQFSIFDSFRDIHVHIYDFLKFVGGLWALGWAWHSTETNLRCVRSSGICTPNLNSLAPIVSEISAFIRPDGQTDMARSTRLVILIKNIYTLWGRKRFLLPVTYFPTNLVYPFTLRVTGIIIKKVSVQARISSEKTEVSA